MKIDKAELLAPAGSLESIYAAVRCGADAVYLGGERFSARANAVNFTDDELCTAVDYCYMHGVKVYQAMNTLVFDEEMNAFLNAAKESARLGMDAFIVQDLGAAMLLKQAIPDMKLNASTQMSVHTKQGALLLKELGFSRVVLSRELSIEQIADICGNGIETEVFVHGALCMAVSGQCHMSAMIGSRSANRGHCAQACRLPFSAVDGDMRYDLSLKDLSGVEHLDKLAQIGVNSFKIEGRMKRAEYVAAAVLACREKMNGNEPDMDTLKAVFSRSGFTDGYLTGKIGAEMFGIRTKDDVVSAEDVFPKLREEYRKETKAYKADFHTVIHDEKPAEITMQCDGISVSVLGDIPFTANNRPTDVQSLSKQLSKLGDTVYDLGECTAEIDGMLMLSAAQINAMRRDVCAKMNEKILRKNTPVYDINEVDINVVPNAKKDSKKIWIQLFKSSQISDKMLLNDDINMIILPITECRNIAANEKIIMALPRFMTDENKLVNMIAEMKNQGFSHALCANLAHVKICRDLGIHMHGGFGLNAANSHTLNKLYELGLDDAVVSFECKVTQISRLGTPIKTGAVMHGFLPVMLTRNCPVKQAVGGCKNCTGMLTDRTGRTFYVRCTDDYSEILNSDKLIMSDRINEMNVDFIVLDFYNESAEQILDTVKSYIDKEKITVGEFTRGLYYRGVI